MALSNGTNLGLLQHGNAGESHFDELVRFFRGVDVLVQAHVISATTATPPASPQDGDAYVVPTGATGVWAAQVGKIARWSTKLAVAAWEYITPKKNWCVAVDDATWLNRNLIYSGTAWVAEKIAPSTPGGALQSAVALHGGTGVPNNAEGADGSFFFRGDGGAGSRVYFKSGGSWTAIL